MNYAQVSLVLDNSDHGLNIDYTEVAITRKIFRAEGKKACVGQRLDQLRIKAVNVRHNVIFHGNHPLFYGFMYS